MCVIICNGFSLHELAHWLLTWTIWKIHILLWQLIETTKHWMKTQALVHPSAPARKTQPLSMKPVERSQLDTQQMGLTAKCAPGEVIGRTKFLSFVWVTLYGRYRTVLHWNIKNSQYYIWISIEIYCCPIAKKWPREWTPGVFESPSSLKENTPTAMLHPQVFGDSD